MAARDRVGHNSRQQHIEFPAIINPVSWRLSSLVLRIYLEALPSLPVCSQLSGAVDGFCSRKSRSIHANAGLIDKWAVK
jgi:hypothetical protein